MAIRQNSVGRRGIERSGDDGTHLGVASCASDNCHGKHEYQIWSQETDSHRIDSHHKSYTVLLGEPAIRIARNLGLPDAKSADICLGCHTDNVRPDRRGPEFRLSDGVGCEACHGGAESWLGVHLTGKGHQANLAAGLYPTENPQARARRCLSCHLGDDTHKMTHSVMGAGHPPLPFELDTFTAIEPAHFTIDKSYVERKGTVNGAQIWAVGRAVTLVKYLDLVLDPENAPKGANPELVLFNCESCHHGVGQPGWHPKPSTGIRPGSLKFDDEHAVMLRIVEEQLAPSEAKALEEQIISMQRASGESWDAVQRSAQRLRASAAELVPRLASHDFTAGDMKAFVDGVAALAQTGTEMELSVAKQATMGLEAFQAAMKFSRYVTAEQARAVDEVMEEVYRALGDDNTYDPQAFKEALGKMQKALRP